ncbi:SET domain-containing protein-lysine N-methyltransferase [Limnoglobus roseus]|nr:SET domain-containing protein-lysine N-methyltransferase [Limnoglobus roseus]
MGRGVFAGCAFRTGQVIEVCPVLVLAPDVQERSLGVLSDYVFKWGEDAGRLAVALGYGSLYNHSNNPNAAFVCRLLRGEIVFRALRPIVAGEQILIDYQWGEKDYRAFS